ncbi:MAG: GNAT family N-acetyltransferase [Alphaproteobacteria bacterium]|nr:GNAT family N-acetyltransferase [Alphaproteobacteria bacterium]
MIVRRLVQGDTLQSAIMLLQRFFREEGFATPDAVIATNVSRMAEINSCGLFVAEHDKTPVGVATVSMEFGIEFGWSAEMGDLYVVPDFRGKGVAAELVRAVEEFLRERSATTYQVTVTQASQQAHGLISFYRKFGFVDEGRQILSKSL